MHSKELSNRKLYFLSFIIPFAIYLIYAAILKLYPFGDSSVLFSDNANQFVSFYTYFKYILASDDNFFYTFSKNLGGDMTGFSAYYLQNPFLLLLLPIKPENVPAMLYFIEALQLSIAGVTFQFFIKSTYDRGNLAFSTAYALLGYAVGYFMLPIYFCNIIMLPLCVAGLCMIYDGQYRKGGILYIVSLSLSVIFNYYIGYMVCIFLFLYAVYLGISAYEKGKAGDICKKTVFFAACSVSAVLLSLFTLLPTVISLSGQKSTPDLGSLGFFRMYRISGSFTNLFAGSYQGNISNTGYPDIYIGIVPVFFVLCYFLNKNISLKKRIASLVFIAVMIFSLNIHTFNVIWHAFNEPVGFGYRFAFLLSFLLLSTGFEGYLSCPDNKIFALGTVIMLLYSVYAVFSKERVQPVKFIVLDVIVIAAVFLLKITENRLHAASGSLIIILCIFEVFLNGYNSMKINTDSAETVSGYKQKYERVYSLINEIKANDGSLYRIEKDFMINMEDAMTFGYNGLSHNSSCETDSVKRFMEKMGFRNQGIWAFYNQGSTVFADAFLGVKYFVSRFDTTDKPYDNYLKSGSDHAFINKYALPMAFFTDAESLKAVNIDGRDPFKIQNDISKCFYFDRDIYTEADISSVRTHNLMCDKLSVSGYDDEIADVRQVTDDAEIIFSKIKEDEPAYVEFDVIPRCDSSNLYFYFDAKNKQGGVRIYVNGADFDDYFSDWRFNVERAGHFEQGSDVKIRISLEGGNGTLSLNGCYIYEENLPELSGWDECVNSNGLNDTLLEKISGSHLKGEIIVPDTDASHCDDLLFTIPYDEGWHVKIDGEKAHTYKALDTLLAIDISGGDNKIPYGKHEIDMYFIPKGIIIGCAVSLFTLIVLVYIFCSDDRLNKIMRQDLNYHD